MTKSTQELLQISQRLDQIVSEDLKGINILRSYLEKRRELETTFAAELETFLNTPANSNSSAITLLYEEMSALFEYHSLLATEIDRQFIPPISRFVEFLGKEKNRLDKSISDSEESIKALEKKVFVAQSQMEQTQIESLHFSSAKNSRAKRNLKNAEKELTNVQNEQRDFLKNLTEVQFPKLFASAAELDFGVRTTIKNSMLNLTSFEVSNHERLLATLETVHSSSERYEPSIETQMIAKSLGVVTPGHRLFAIVRCSFAGGDVNDLPLTRGQFIEVIRRHPSGWWEGECDGRRGLFPMNFVELITDVESGAITIGEVFEVDAQYIPQKPDEIALDYGDVVYISTVRDGWCDGYSLGSGDHGKFPTSVVRHVKNLHPF